ncbi:MAG: hypothetical protein GF364_04625 [Candidatus Lokiarchaeota archaeon]|nr:hypothetical protein [Candidatus Lokiarchaeota archaeon]
MAANPLENQIVQQLNNIVQYMDGVNAQINTMITNLDKMSKQFAEGMASLSENMRLIIEVIKKQRSNIGETLDEMSNDINSKITELWEEKTLESIGSEELEAISKIKELNALVSENLYMQQLMSVIQSVREMVGRALAIKAKKQT